MERIPITNPHPGALNKRKLSSLSGLSPHRAEFPRKRSATACQLCRNRKTKCDNGRPVCSSCCELGAECVYMDQTSSEPSASQILQRLEHLIGLVEPAIRRNDSIGSATTTRFNDQDSSHDGNATVRHPSISNSSAPNPPEETLPAIETTPPNPAPLHEYFGSSEDVLAWPIFSSKYDRRWIEALIFDPTLPSDDLSRTPTSPRVHDDSLRNNFQDPRQNSDSVPDISEKDVPHLIEAFFLNVHVKNPIFDLEYLRGMARSVVQHGFSWDASTCLVLIVCALAAISSPFECLPIRQDETPRDPEDLDNSLSTTPAYPTAEAYYLASRKRIGLLKDTLLATECHFMSGVYEMYSLRPLQSAISFNRACVTFQTLTWMRTEYYISESQLGKARASRLYWSCLKSEHEVSIEIRFPSSGLTKLNYTSAFPPPPGAEDTGDWYGLYAVERAESESPKEVHSVKTQSEFEHGWYYYLADIAARRLLQRVIEVFYRTNEGAWVEYSSSYLVHTVEELDRQLDEWHRALPRVISFDMDTLATDELAYHLQARALEIKERIYRPFLYRLIHGHHTLTSAERNAHEPQVTQHAITCTRLIQQWNIRHRHHGTWLMSRQTFASALLLLAARKAGISLIPIEQFEKSVACSLATLRFWEREAPDLKTSRQILEDICQGLHLQID